MGLSSLVQYALFLLVVAMLVKPVGGYLARVFGGENTFLDPALRPVEHLIYKLARVDPEQQMDWKGYAISFVGFDSRDFADRYVFIWCVAGRNGTHRRGVELLCGARAWPDS